MKRALSLILTLAMLLALFSGCTTNTETPDPSGGSATPGTSSDATPPAGGDAADTIDMSTVTPLIAAHSSPCRILSTTAWASIWPGNSSAQRRRASARANTTCRR